TSYSPALSPSKTPSGDVYSGRRGRQREHGGNGGRGWTCPPHPRQRSPYGAGNCVCDLHVYEGAECRRHRPRVDTSTLSTPREVGAMTTEDTPSPALALVAAALTAHMAESLGAPRLAVQAARRARALADQLNIELSPLLAAVSEDDE